MTQSAGVVCRFTTNSKTLAFTYTVETVGNEQSFDIWVNGIFLSYNRCDALTGRISLALPDERSNVEIYFPSHREGRIFDVTLDDGAEFSLPVSPKYRILFKGDSITNGSTTRFTSMGYTHQVARALKAHIINQGIGGEEFNPRAVDQDLKTDLDLVVLAFGTNDWAHAPSHVQMVANVNGFLAGLRDFYPEKKIVMILPIWRADYTLTTKKVGSFEDARTLLREAAARVNATVIDGMLLVPHVAEVFADARLHPSALGFQFYAENLAPHFKKILEK
jgi:lysophospholipase L1-like esterase